MSNSYFQFKQFTIQQDRCAMKVTTDACLFGSLIPNLSKGERVMRILDIGTGTGLLSLMYAQKNLNGMIDAIEIDKDAFDQAKENIAASPWNKRINIFPADARHFMYPTKYDLIFSNPPFFENELQSDDPKRNLALHSNELSLAELMQIIKNNLSPEGLFFILLPYKRYDEIRNIFRYLELTIEKIIFIRQSVNHDYFRIMLIGKPVASEANETSFDEISIWDEKQQYTFEFTALLKDYYLYL